MPGPVQGVPAPGTSSTTPLQSSSTPLQVSVDLATAPTHEGPPLAEQTAVPAEQRVPAPEFWQSTRLPVGQQASPAHGSVKLLSTRPSQLLSFKSQTSAAGETPPRQTFAP
jgi:hypothetical protein